MPAQWNDAPLIALGWSDAEELLCVQDNGLVVIYDMFGNYQHTFSMGQEAKDTKIIDAQIFPSSSGTGVTVLTSNFRAFLINNIKKPKNWQLPDIPSESFNGYTTNKNVLNKYKNYNFHRIKSGSNMLANDNRRS